MDSWRGRASLLHLVLSFLNLSLSTSSDVVNDIYECGKKIEKLGPTVWKPKEASPYKYPWMVFVFQYDIETDNMTAVCGGSLVHSKFVITAAHCVAGGDTENTLVILGAHDVTQSWRKFDYKLLSNIYVYPYYDTKNNQDEEFKKSQDIAILELEEYVQFGPKINAICLPSEIDVEKITHFDDKEAIVAGWGTTGYNGMGDPVTSIDKLMAASVLIRTNFWCWKKMSFFKE